MTVWASLAGSSSAMLVQNSNFPDNLDIRPSILNDIVRQGTDSERVFGIEAQEDAIRLYGIAGRSR